MRKNGLDPNKLSVESIEPSARIAMLATRKIPAIDFFNMTKPAMDRARCPDAKVTTFLFADHGLDLYSNGIGATETYLKENPEVVKAFVRATLRGYQYTFKHPDEAAEIDPEICQGAEKRYHCRGAQDRRGVDRHARGQDQRYRVVHAGADEVVGRVDGGERRLPAGKDAEAGRRL